MNDLVSLMLIHRVQAISLFLAMILRAMVSTRSVDYDSDEDFVVIRRPLLVAQGAPAYLPTTVDSRGFHPDLWSSRMRQKVRTALRYFIWTILNQSKNTRLLKIVAFY